MAIYYSCQLSTINLFLCRSILIRGFSATISGFFCWRFNIRLITHDLTTDKMVSGFLTGVIRKKNIGLIMRDSNCVILVLACLYV